MSYLITLLLALLVRMGYLNKTGGMYYVNKRRASLFDRTQDANLRSPWGVDLCLWTKAEGERVEQRALRERMFFAIRT